VDPVFSDAFESKDFHLQSLAGSYYDGIWQADLQDSPSIDAGNPRGAFSNETWYNGLTVNQGAYGDRPEASRTYYTGQFFDISLYASPTNGGDLFQWPEAPPAITNGYPTNRQITVSAVVAAHFEWGQWEGDLSTPVNPTNFFVTNDMVIAAVFDAITSNSNGVPNWWLAQYGLPTNQAAADAHSDSDPHANWQEYYAGTDPTNSASVFLLNGLDDTATSRLALSFRSVVGKNYIVESTTDIVGGSWVSNRCSTTLGGPLIWDPAVGIGGTMTIYVEGTNAHAPFRMKVW
jgi:hypothetical protein